LKVEGGPVTTRRGRVERGNRCVRHRRRDR
jgi:hypothetical protein